MFIKNNQITLRCAEPDDAELIYVWENDRRVWRVSGTHAPYSRFQIEQFLLADNDIAANKQLRLMIDCNDLHEPVGCIDIYDYDAINQRASIGILIDERFRRQGYAKAALTLCVDYLFSDLLLHQVHCCIDELNVESQQLFTSQGFQLCGRKKGWINTVSGFIDLLEYQRIND